MVMSALIAEVDKQHSDRRLFQSTQSDNRGWKRRNASQRSAEMTYEETRLPWGTPSPRTGAYAW